MTPTDTPYSTDPELAVPLDTVCYLIARLHDLQGKTASTLSEGDTDDEPYLAVLEDRGNDPVEDKIRPVIDDLDEEAQVDLVALLWLGRDVGEWTELRELALQKHNDATAGYLIGTPLVADYLAAGLDVLGFDCSEWLKKMFDPLIAVNAPTKLMCDSTIIDRKSKTKEGLFRNVQKTQMNRTMDWESNETYRSGVTIDQASALGETLAVEQDQGGPLAFTATREQIA